MIRSLGAVLLGTVCTDNLQAVQPATSYILASRGTDAHRVTAGEGFEYLPPRETCSHADVTVDDSRSAGSSRRFRLRTWLEDQRRDNLS